MNPASHLIQRVLGLGPPLTRDLFVEHDLRVPMPDGIELLADLWAPRTDNTGSGSRYRAAPSRGTSETRAQASPAPPRPAWVS